MSSRISAWLWLDCAHQKPLQSHIYTELCAVLAGCRQHPKISYKMSDRDSAWALRVHTRGRCLCSRGMVGALSAETLDAKVDINGTTFKDASARVGSGGSSHEVCAPSSPSSALLLQHIVPGGGWHMRVEAICPSTMELDCRQAADAWAVTAHRLPETDIDDLCQL